MPIVMNNPKITIVTACWRPDRLKDVIASIEAQTYTNWHHVLVNDNNPETREQFKDLCDGKKRFWIDLGLRTHYYGALARNIGVMVSFSYIREVLRDANNEFVVFHDDDNSWTPDHLQSLVDLGNQNPEASMICSDAMWFGVKDKDWREARKCSIQHNKIDLGQVLYRKDLFFKYGFFNPRPRRKQKYDFELIEKMVNGETMDKVLFTCKPTFLMSYRKK